MEQPPTPVPTPKPVEDIALPKPAEPVSAQPPASLLAMHKAPINDESKTEPSDNKPTTAAPDAPKTVTPPKLSAGSNAHHSPAMAIALTVVAMLVLSGLAILVYLTT